MILVTKLNGAPFAVNADLIERITAGPDTTLTLVDGVRYVVRESLSEVVQRVTEYRATILDLAYRGRSAAASPAPSAATSEPTDAALDAATSEPTDAPTHAATDASTSTPTSVLAGRS